MGFGFTLSLQGMTVGIEQYFHQVVMPLHIHHDMAIHDAVVESLQF